MSAEDPPRGLPPEPASGLGAVGRRALEAATRGQRAGLGPLEAAVAEAPPGEEREAWSLALAVARGVVGAEPGAVSGAGPALLSGTQAATATEIRGYVAATPVARAAAAEAAALLAREARLELDRDALASFIDLEEQLTADLGEARWALEVELGRAWVELLRGGAAVDERAQHVQATAAAAHLGRPLVEAATLRALAALAAGELGAATALARRASLMAASEQLEDEMALANLVLARLRRHTGRPHLAARIVGQVVRWAPPPFRAWMRWELVLAGGDDLGPADPESPDAGAGARVAGFVPRFSGAVDALVTFLDAATAGDARAARAAAQTMRERLAQAAPLLEEAEALVRAADPEGPDAVAAPLAEAVASWWSGQSPLPPFGLHGLCHAAKDGASGDTTACVLVRPREAGRRVLRLGLERAAARAGSAVTGEQDQAQSRTDMGLAVLGLAGPTGLPVGDFFRAVYGFAYEAALHRGILNVLVHRMRKRVEGAGNVERDDDLLRLEVSEPLAILDARCSEPALQRVLWLLARRGTTTAKDASQLLGIPLRTAQAALQQLAADGTCTVSRDGKQLAYRLDDTTFSEPTPYVPTSVSGDSRREP